MNPREKVGTKGDAQGSKAFAKYLNKLWEAANGWKTDIVGIPPITTTSVDGCVLIGYAEQDTVYVGKTDSTWTRGTLASPTSCVISIWKPGATLGSAWTDSTVNITAYDTGMIPTSASALASGTQVRIVKVGAHWLYDGHDCG